jgi:hypothetical protein
LKQSNNGSTDVDNSYCAPDAAYVSIDQRQLAMNRSILESFESLTLP